MLQYRISIALSLVKQSNKGLGFQTIEIEVQTIDPSFVIHYIIIQNILNNS